MRSSLFVTTSIFAHLVLACGGGSRTNPIGNGSGPEPAGTTPLCIDTYEVAGQAIALEREGNPGLVSDGNDLGVSEATEEGWLVMAVVQRDEDELFTVLIREGCSDGQASCDPRLARVERAGERLVITHQTPLPDADQVAVMGDYPFVVEWMALEDGDGDGEIEVWMSYQVIGEPEPAVGSTTAQHLAVFARADAALRLHAIHGLWPEASSLEACSSEILAVDADCDGDRDLFQTRTCLPGACAEEAESGAAPSPECAGAAVERAVYLRGADGAFTRRAAK
jgi:hypothetical protein